LIESRKSNLGGARVVSDREFPLFPAVSCNDAQDRNRVSRMSVNGDMSMMPAPRYARFSRRLRGIVLDWIIATVILFGTVLVAVSIQNDNVSRALGIVVVIALLLYEPVLVSLTGGTVGHYFTNLRVVDDRDGGNVSFPKACARVVIKGLLGWYSFVILAATRRNQAVHDLITRSTVQIRDPAKALPGQYVTERSEPAASGMPQRWRRIAVISGYLILLIVLAAGIGLAFLSPRCLNANFCSAGERTFDLATNVILLVMVAFVIALGWKGKLFGARKA
jgi:uncharacterized RDD family membrane protein YckC